ncbi:MAG: energy transducer TonB [Rickettsiales bacterium]|nr:energy transducer TonB [Rickettsiales bacterium]
MVVQNISTKKPSLLKLDITKISAKFYSESDNNKVTKEVVEKTSAPLASPVAPNNTSQIKQEPKIPTKPLVEKVESEQEAEEIKVNKAQAPKMIPINNVDIPGFKPSPIYPKRALRLNREGIVIIEALVSKEGVVTKIDIIQSSGFAILDKSASNAVMKWRFDQAALAGSEVLVRIPVEFIINK